MYQLNVQNRMVFFDPEKWNFCLEINGEKWEIVKKPYVQLKNEIRLYLADGKCSHEAYETGVVKGVRAEYTFDSSVTGLKVIAQMSLEKCSGRLCFDVRVENDKLLEVEELCYPGGFSLNAEAGKGYTVAPVGMGALIPAKDPREIPERFGTVYSRGMYMPFFGQMRNGTGYLAIYKTPYDGKFHLSHEANGDTIYQPAFIESLGTIRYKREMIYDFYENCDYVSIAKGYRRYMEEKGEILTLKQKAAVNANVEKMYGRPTLRVWSKISIKEGTKFYNTEDPSKNQTIDSFADTAKRLQTLHDNGITCGYLDVGGWPCDGYDHKHPDPFPIAEEPGGQKGFLELRETCRKLDIMFSVHDQYRDYYYDSESFDFHNAILNPDGTHPYCNTWHGGAHTMLCAKLAPAYIRRNLKTFQEMGADLDAVYLDVFSVVELDECMNPDHMMTREECAQYRRECLQLLFAKGMITSSEEVIDCILPAMPMTGHAMYLVVPNPDGSGLFAKPTGIPIPLFSLVYHDCIIMPFEAITERNRDHYGIPGGDSSMCHAALNGGSMFITDYENLHDLAEAKRVLALHKRIADQEMTNHEFVDGNIRKQRTTFQDGTKVEVDFDANTFRIIYPD